MSILNDVISSKSKGMIKAQQQPLFPLKYDTKYGPYAAITSIEESYKADFINLLLTSPGEWPMSPDLGVGLKHYLFELPGSEKLLELGPTIRFQLKRNLPGVNLLDIKFDYNNNDLDSNKLRIILVYTILQTSGYVTSFNIDQDSNSVVTSELEQAKIQAADLFDRRSGLLSSVESL